MTSDFYVTYKDGKEKVFSVKPSRNVLKKKRTKEKLAVEKVYWERFRHVPFEIVYNDEMNIVLAENIRMVCMFYDLSSVFDEMSMLKHYIATKKSKLIWNQNRLISSICLRFTEMYYPK